MTVWLNMRDVVNATGLSEDAIESRLRRGQFPKPTGDLDQVRNRRYWAVDEILPYAEHLELIRAGSDKHIPDSVMTNALHKAKLHAKELPEDPYMKYAVFVYFLSLLGKEYKIFELRRKRLNCFWLQHMGEDLPNPFDWLAYAVKDGYVEVVSRPSRHSSFRYTLTEKGKSVSERG